MCMSIREYTDEDFSLLVEMTTEIVGMMGSMDPHKRFRPKDQLDADAFTRSELQRINTADGKVFLAEVDGEVVGYIMGTIVSFEERDSLNKFPTKQGYIDALYVEEKVRGEGISSELMKAMEEYFKNVDCDFTSVSCIAVNDAARSFYEKSGYAAQYIDFLKKL